MSKEDTGLMVFKNTEIALIKDTVAKDATDEELKLFLYTAQLRGLNPLTKQMHFVKRGGQGTIQTGIDGFRLIAQRTGKYSPSPKPTEFIEKNGRLYSATVYGMKMLGSQLIEFSATAIFDEYKAQNPMWQKMPHTMLEKCAEAKMLRRGFPEELSGLYADEEMAQADSPVTIIHTQETPKIPQKGATSPASAPEPSEGEEVPPEEEMTDLFPKLTSKFGKDKQWTKICWVHGVEWFDGKFGKSHKTADGWCNWKQALKPITEAICESKGMDVVSLNEECKQEYEGRTWSKLSEGEQLEMLEGMLQPNEGR